MRDWKLPQLRYRAIGRRRISRYTIVTGIACWAAGLALLSTSAAAYAKGSTSSGQGSPGHSQHQKPGDNNRGDVWLDNVGQPAGPGHEHDPHLLCQNINLWGNDLADSSHWFTIDGWSPTGSGKGDFTSGSPTITQKGYTQDQAWPGTQASPSLGSWTYNTKTGGSQVTAVIDVKTLIAHAIANGDKALNVPATNKQGFHFKLQFGQDPQKHKTFWVECPGLTSTPTPTPTGTPTPTPTGTPTPTPTGNTHGRNSTPTPSPTGGVQGKHTSKPTPSPSPVGSVKAASTTTPNTGADISTAIALLLLGSILLGGAAVMRRRAVGSSL